MRRAVLLSAKHEEFKLKIFKMPVKKNTALPIAGYCLNIDSLSSRLIQPREEKNKSIEEKKRLLSLRRFFAVKRI